MMIRCAKVDKTLNGLLLINIFFLAIFSMAGCGGNADIPEASVLSNGRLTLSWVDVPGAASYDMYISTTPGVTALNSYKISGVSSPLTITDLEPAATYYFMLMVYSDTGESRNSKEISYQVARTEGWIDFGDLLVSDEPAAQAPSTAGDKALEPAKKTSQTATHKQAPAAIPKATPAATKKASQPAQSSAAGTRDVTLAWDNVPGATSYNIYWSDNPGVTRRNGTKVDNVKNPHQLKGLIKGKKYYFVVTAVNASDESNESEEFSFTVGK